MGYGYFLTLLLINIKVDFLVRIKNPFTNSTYLVEIDKCNLFDEMNVGSFRSVQFGIIVT